MISKRFIWNISKTSRCGSYLKAITTLGNNSIYNDPRNNQYHCSHILLPNDLNNFKNFTRPDLMIVRNKYLKGKASGKGDDDDEESSLFEEEDDDGSGQFDKNSKVLKIGVNSLRVDLIVKSGLGIARK